MTVPKKVAERFASGLKRLVPIVAQQHARDVSEADTVGRWKRWPLMRPLNNRSRRTFR